MREEIKKRQNEEQMLKIQYSSRGYYNSAERFGNLAWLCCLISSMTLLIPDSVPVACQLAAPILADVVALVFSRIQEKAVEKAAGFRAYFDAYVLGINDSYKPSAREALIGDAQEYCDKHPGESKIQMENTGFDTPPGVKDWYDLKGEYHGRYAAIFECQKQNVWWEERLSKIRIRVLIAVIVLACISFIAMYLLYDQRVMIRIALSSALILKAIERIIAEHKFITISHEIDGAVSVMIDKQNSSNIERLQDLIDARRGCNVVGINWIHKLKANPLSTTYRSRKND